ncbi:hypothetical protein PR003_g7611 [Phytophthora rubi]|uniref:Uncharacterized protein n=1 Tax=Phytophthora rubi TaxID=129364 RepID=A0A6A3MND3_9STRA|nr:hypothetical protein PR002_g8145 [Phytophthora rubi]KAE9038814.1 hypothetical protein PR001_g7798 [Phytophthora rubi]KAE9346072.1 hypothetical protein PR003_g7611 [Phytophthora rubi]
MQPRHVRWVALLAGLDGLTPRLAVRVRRASSTPSGAIGSTTSSSCGLKCQAL